MVGKIIRNKIGNRAFAALLAGLLLLAGLVGCGSGETEADGESATSDAGAASNGSEDAGEEVTKITAATGGIPAPFITVDENNEISGSDTEILRAVFDRLPQYELEIIKTDDPLTGLTSGLYDIAFNNYNWVDERGELYYFSLPYNTVYQAFLQRADDDPLTGLQDLVDRESVVAVSAGYNQATTLERWNKENPDKPIHLQYVDTDYQIITQNIIDGKADAYIASGPVLEWLIEEFGLEDELVVNTIDSEGQEFLSPHNNTYFLFPKDEVGAALREEVDQVLLELKKEGTLSEILTRYLGTDTSPNEEDMKETLN